MFLRTDEPHTEKMNRPDCLVLSTHRWGQIFRRAQFPRRHLNKWQIFKSGNVPTYFGAQLVLELLWKTCSAMTVLLCLRYKTSKTPNLPLLYPVHVSLPCLPTCHAPSHRSQLASSCLLPCPSAIIKRSACTDTHISFKGPIRANAPKCRTYVQHKLIVKANADWSLVIQPAGYTICLKCIVQV